MKDNIIRISIIKAFEYYISIQKHAIFLERWSLNGKELYCIGNVYFLNSNWGIEHNLPSARIYTRSEFSLKDAAENNYNDQILKLKNLPHIENITEYKDIKNDCREYNTFDAEKFKIDLSESVTEGITARLDNLYSKIEEIESKLTSSQRKNSRSQSKGGDEE